MSQDTRELERDTAKSPQSEKRIALVIGNGAYRHAPMLANPANDAAAMAEALRDVGFEVIGGESAGINLTQEQMESLITEFGERLRSTKGVGLFYYAGHGLASGGQNYLVPVDADIPDETKVRYKAIPIGMILDEMEAAGNGFNLVILDACRNNPFARAWRVLRDIGDAKGLVNSNPPRGTLILYATQPGGVSSDGAGKNGLFTEALLKQIKKPNLEFDPLVKLVARDVEENSKQKQSPWKEGLYSGDFYFGRSEAAKGEPGKDETVTPKGAAAVEREAWGYIKGSQNAQDFRDFLKDFPAGANADNAKIKLEQAVWEAVKDSKDRSAIQAYLNEFPSGVNAPLARIRLRQVAAPIIPAGKTAGTVRKNSIGMELVYVPPGEFMMGSNNGRANEKPVHNVIISEGFWMGKLEVTQSQWEQVMGTTLRQQRDKNMPEWEIFGEGPNYPIYYVSWAEAKEYVRHLNERNDAYQYSLPSEAQWEYAVRAETQSDYYASIDDIAWYGNNSGRGNLDADTIWENNNESNGFKNWKQISANGGQVHPVGTKKPNNFGLYDMSGNVGEWCEDIFNADGYEGLPMNGLPNLSRGDPSLHVSRGGSWVDRAGTVRSAFRGSASSGNFVVGFRVLARLRAGATGEFVKTESSETKANLNAGSIKAGTLTSNKLKMNFAYVPEGSFQMGESSDVHTVSISHAFYLGTTEVTQSQWASVMFNNPSSFSNCDNCPVENVTWDDVQAFIKKLNDRGDGKYRLPTEAEWEYAARAGSTTKYSFGDGEGLLGSYAWYDANSGSRTHEVATKRPNSWGLYDMHGNVWEWVQDQYGDYPSGNATDPAGASSGTDRVIRGGSWGVGPDSLHSATRTAYSPAIRDQFLGFRLVKY